MKFEDYLNIVVPKIGPIGAFDIARDAKYKGLENILIEKGVATKEEIEAEIEKQLGESAHNIHQMPPVPLELKGKNENSPKD